jgi:secreted PhoX family phosphatase
MGRGLALTAAASTLEGCITGMKSEPPPFVPLNPTEEDMLKLAAGFQYEILLRFGQPLNSAGDKFGFNNDYLAYLPLDPRNPFEGLLWVNHEYHDPYYCSGWRKGQPRTAKQVALERKTVGGSIVHIRRGANSPWEFVPNSSYNRRLDAFTPIPFAAGETVLGKKTAIGTFGNCAGGITPWGTILTCEENYMNFVGEALYANGKRTIKPVDGYLSWDKFVSLPPEHYGWVVEVDLKTGKAKKHTSIGRFAHECATCIVASDGRTVVYSGDDAEDEHIYKFISAKPGSLENGELFVADTENGRWLSLSLKNSAILRKHFKTQNECLIRTREAAKLVGATPQDRPEDIEIDPHTRAVIVSCTNNKKQNRPFGALMKIEEKNADPLSMEFQASTFIAGGPKSGFACPDNLAFDPRGNLWMCTDISAPGLKNAPYESFGNNGLFYIPLSGDHAGRAFQVASAPNGAELTGPMFAPDGSLFLSVQHPGEWEHYKGYAGSHWPDGGEAEPAPCVVQIRGPALERLTSKID